MKKLLIVLLALSVLGIFAVAQDAPAASLSVGAWGRGWYAPVASDGTDNIVFSGPGWGGTNGARVGVSFTGTSENIGFTWNPGVTGQTFTAICDQAKIWVAINPMIKIEIGQIQGDVLRGKFGDFGDVLSVSGNDNIFARFNPGNGMLLNLTPVEGLYLGAALDVPGNAQSGLAKDAYNAIQVGGGYTIANVGQFRAQYIGYKAPATKGTMQVAFNYTGMAGLGLDVGVKYPLDSDLQTMAAFGVNYAADALSVALRGNVKFMGATGADKLNAQIAAQLQYVVADPYTLGAEVALNGMSATPDNPLTPDAKTVDVYPFVQINYDKGFVKVGVDIKAGLETGAKTAYEVPILLQYGF